MGKYKYIRKTLTWDGKRYEVKGKTEEEAIRKLALLQDSLRRGERTVGENSTVDRWFREWFELYKVPSGITQKSLSMYREKYEGYIRPAIGQMKLRDVREAHLQRILNSQAGRSYSHVSKIRMVMRSMFGKARSTRLIMWNPAEDLSLPEYTKGTHRAITEEERAHILAVAADHPSGLWVQTILYSGLRPGETVPLLWRDIDFEKDEIHVNKAVESGTLSIKDPKTDAGFRNIPIHQELRPLLLAAQRGPEDLVFPTSGGKMRDSKALRRLWTGFLRDLDIHMGAVVYRNRIVESVVAEDLTPYCLRHTFCTDLERAGVPINVAKVLMGHSDIAMTANIYTHRNQAVLHENMIRLAESQICITSTQGSSILYAFVMADETLSLPETSRETCFSYGELDLAVGC